VLSGLPIHPNAPRLVTVAASVALVAIGVVLTLPVPEAVDLLEPIGRLISPFGLGLNESTGQLAMFAGTALLTVGCLVRGL
jgi:hypothetical protein